MKTYPNVTRLGIALMVWCFSLSFAFAEEQQTSTKKREATTNQEVSANNHQGPIAVVESSATKDEGKEQKARPMVYKPPKRGVPSGREGGGTRGGYQGNVPAVQTNLVLDVLAPGPTQVIGVTTQEQPDLYWYISEPVKSEIFLTINDEAEVQPILEARLPAPMEAGAQRISLAQLGVRLAPGKIYRWYVSLVQDPDYRSRDIIAGARIERREPDHEVQARLVHELSVDAAALHAEAGFWYDAIAAISGMIAADPYNSRLRHLRATLLDQVGLQNIADLERLAHQG